jgi:hypothetical protein
MMQRMNFEKIGDCLGHFLYLECLLLCLRQVVIFFLFIRGD